MQQSSMTHWPAILFLVLVTACVLQTSRPSAATGGVAPENAPVLAAPAAAQAQPPSIPAQEAPEVLTRGPVHEAFAQPVSVQVQAGLVIQKQPPANIREIPPAERPATDHAVWVPGYWSWDVDRNDFIWVSGCWRVAPPGMNWVPGYWASVSNGWEWVAGFWTPADASEISYLPPPPATEEIDPSGPPPDAADMWVPGCWYWNDGQYVLRHGYWLHQQPGWVWVPSHYCWTPRGYTFAAGHWDYTLDERGVLFAPVCLPANVCEQPDFVYSPDVCVDVGLLTDCLFACPCYEHYFFGDYYDSFYFGCGIYPWFASTRFHTWCCPTFAYCRWQGCLRDRNWEENVRSTFDRRCTDPSLRPSRTLREQDARVAALAPAERANWQLGRPLSALAAAAEPSKFTRLDLPARNEIARQANDVHVFRDARTRWEQPAVASHSTPASGEPQAARAEGWRTPANWSPSHVAPIPAPVAHPVPARWFTPYNVPQTPAASAPQVRHDFRPTYEPPREVHLSQPELVRIPTESVWQRAVRPMSIERTPPSHPTYEHTTDSGYRRRGR